MRKSFQLFLGAILFAVHAFAADVIPAARRYAWNAGVPGGFEQYSNAWTVVPITGLDNTGVADCSSAIQSAINSAANGTVLTIGAGNFRLDSSIILGSRDYLVLRGAGMGVTKLICHNSANVITSGEPTSFTFPSGVTLASNASRGATSVTVTDGSGFSDTNGLQIFFKPNNDTSVPVVSVSGFQGMRTFLGVITSSSGTTVNFTPALPFDIPSGSPVFRESGNGTRAGSFRDGVEQLTIDCTDSTNQIGLSMNAVKEGWAYAVEVLNPGNYNISLGQATFCTIQKCRVDGVQNPGAVTSRNGYLVGNCVGILFQDNIAANHVSAFELTSGSACSVFAYNFFNNIHVGTAIGSAFNINHNPQNSFNLYEGNVVPRIQSDGYFGGSSNETVFRNWLTGTNGTDVSTVTGNQLPVTLNRFTRQFNVVANQVGRTGLGITWTYINASIGFDTTSSSSLSVGSGAVAATIGTGLRYTDNGCVALFYSSANSTNWMAGRITNYDPSAGTCTFTAYSSHGSGTHNDWVVKGGSGYGVSATTGQCFALGAPNIGGGGFFGDNTICAPQTQNIWWRCWSGIAMNRRGNFNSSTAYTVGDVVDINVPGPFNMTGGNNCTQWLANNAAKNGQATWATPSDSQSDWLPLGSNSFQELDYDVYGTMLLKGNWNAANNAIPSNETITGGDTYPSSYYLSSKPSWFGTITWPAIDPTSPTPSQGNASSLVVIPAAWREINGNENYLNITASPSFSPVAGMYSTAQSVTISTATSGATMRYTTDGSTPTSSSGTIYSTPVSISTTTTLRAIAYKAGLDDSSVTSGTFTISSVTADPSFSPPAGVYLTAQSVTISSATSGATIRYTTDGTDPTPSTGTIYSTPIAVNSSLTLKAIAYKSGLTDSAVVSAGYTIGSPIGGGGNATVTGTTTVTGTLTLP